MQKSSTNDSDQLNLERFISAQQDSYAHALREVTAGKKFSHWMWYVFPQLRGLGMSSTAHHYGITGLDEAKAYLEHEILGPRLREICEAALSVKGKTALDIFGRPDDMKLRSCATLFAQISEDGSVFHKILDMYFNGTPDERTLQLL